MNRRERRRGPRAGHRRIRTFDHGPLAVIVTDSRPILSDYAWTLLGALDTPIAFGSAPTLREAIACALKAGRRIDELDAIEGEHEPEHEAITDWDEPANGWLITHYRHAREDAA